MNHHRVHLVVLLLPTVCTQQSSAQSDARTFYRLNQPHAAGGATSSAANGWTRLGLLADPEQQPRLQGDIPVSATPLPAVVMELQWYTNSIARVTLRDPRNQRWRPERVLPDYISLEPLSRPPTTPKLSVEPSQDTLGFSVRRPGNQELLFDFHELFYSDQYITFSSSLPAYPTLYGLGDRKGPLKVEQTTYTIWNTDDGTHYDLPLYGSHTFYMDWRQNGGTLQSAATEVGDQGTSYRLGSSTAVHGVFLLNSNAMDVTLDTVTVGDDSTEEARLKFQLSGGIIDLFFFAGPSPMDVVQQYHSLIGMPMMPPLWSLGMHQCRWGYENLQAVVDVADGYEQNRLPLDAVWVDIDYMDQYKIFTNDPVNFPLDKFQQFTELLHSKGQRLVLITDPGIKIAATHESHPCADDADGALQTAIGLDCAAALAAIPTANGNACEFSLSAWLHQDVTMAEICPVSCGTCQSAAQSYTTYQELVERGLYLRDADANPTIGKVWAGPSLFPDWVHPNTTTFWAEQVSVFHEKIQFDGLWIDMNEVANFCDGRCIIDVETEIQRYAEDPNSLFSCMCEELIEPNRFDEPMFVPKHFRIADVDGDAAGSCRAHSLNRRNSSLDCGALSLATRHFPYTDERYNEWNMHALYAHMEARATHASIQAARGSNMRTFILTRSSFAGTGHFAARWNGDNKASFDDMKMSIPGILAGGMFGFAMVGEDICGFGAPDDPSIMPDLCSRWMQLGAWYPFARNHNAWHNPGHEPFNLGSEVLQTSRHALNTRMSLTLYFYNLYFEAATAGGTVARPLSFEFPDDTNTWTIDTQFMVGPAFLISPVLEAGVDQVDVYFPGGDAGTVWYDYWTGKRIIVSESRHLVVPAVLGEPMPVHVRGGSILPRQAAALTTASTVVQPIDILVVLGDMDGAIRRMTSASTDCTKDVSGLHERSDTLQRAPPAIAAKGQLYLDDGETVIAEARATRASFTAVWSRAGACVGDPSEFDPVGFILRSTVEESEHSSVPDIITVTVLGVDCPPGDVTVDGHPATLTWHADINKAIIHVEKSALASFTLDYKCGSLGQYALSQERETPYGLEGTLEFAPNPQIEYGSFRPISPLRLTAAAMSDTQTFRVTIDDPADDRWQVPNIVQGSMPATTPSPDASLSDLVFEYDVDIFLLSIRRAGDPSAIPVLELRSLFFSDQLIVFTTSIEADPTIYGLQSRKETLRLPFGLYPIVSSSWFPSPKGHPLYSANPSFTELRRLDQQHTAMHGVFILNSNAMDAILVRVPMHAAVSTVISASLTNLCNRVGTWFSNFQNHWWNFGYFCVQRPRSRSCFQAISERGGFPDDATALGNWISPVQIWL
eukprot:SAG31_NODE_701_length_12730_cov_3.008709_6_plen_1346_part_00